MQGNGQKGGMINPFALWIGVVGAAGAGVSGIGSMGQLGELNATLEEQVRQAEIRGQLRADIRANRESIMRQSDLIKNMMPREGINRLHDHQQNLIDKIIDWMNTVATKDELNLAINKMKMMNKSGE